MITSPSDLANQTTIELAPSYKIPLFLIIVSIPLLLVKWWLSLPVSLFGLFLLLQTVTLRLQFSETALDIYRSQSLIRRFPYSEWSNWRIFWPKVPILFYFKEVKSIHFLPIIFDAKTLTICLEKYCPRQD